MDDDARRKTIFIVAGILVLLFIIAYWFLGVRTIRSIIRTMLWFVIILGVLFALSYLFWFLFIRKEKFDATYVNKKTLLQSCKRGNTGILGGLYLSGDKAHSRVYWGSITGYCRISVLSSKPVLDGKGNVKKELDKDTGLEREVYETVTEEQDVFSVSHAKNFFTKLFEEEKVVRVSPSDHDELVGDVTLYGYSLIKIAEYWFLNKDYLDVKMIDKAILNEAHRTLMFEMLKDTKIIIDRATGLDAKHQKRLEEKSALEIPVTIDEYLKKGKK